MDIKWDRLLAALALSDYKEVQVIRAGSESYQRLQISHSSEKIRPGINICDDWSSDELTSSYCIIKIGAAPDDLAATGEYAAIFIQSEDSIDAVFSEITNRMLDLEYWLNHIEKSICRNESLQSIIEFCEPYLRKPAIVWDGGFRVLAHTNTPDIDYPDFYNTIKKGYTPSYIMKRLKESNYFHDVNLADHPLYKKAAVKERYYNIYTKLGESDIRGYACVYCGDEKLQTGYLELCDEFFHVLNLYFAQAPHDETGRYMYESLFFEMLNDAHVPASKINERLSFMNDIPFESDFLLICLQGNDPTVFPIEYFHNEVRKAFPSAKSLVYKKNVLVLHSFNEKYGGADRYYQRILKDTEKVSANYGTQMGVSNRFKQLSGLNAANKQCRAALDIGNQLEPGALCYSYSEMYPFHMLANMEKEIDLLSLCEPHLLEHMEEIEPLHWDILKTYLLLERRATETASKLNMHRNTVIYNINKLETLFETDFGTYEIRRRWLLSFDILEWLNREQNA